MVIPFVVPEILGRGGTTPQMPLSCQKRQMPLTVNLLALAIMSEKNTSVFVRVPR